jgi:hypothetical protein
MWSGRNCVVHRELAAKALHEKLVESQKKYPGTPHILIGHSHGGNIAIQATAGLPEHEQVRILCLSTPFLYVLPRPNSERLDQINVPVFGHAFLLMVVLAMLARASGFPNGWLFRIAVFLATFACWLPIVRMMKRYRSWATRFCTPQAPIAEIPTRSLLLLRFLGDEASFAISASQALQYALFWTTQKEARLIQRTQQLLAGLLQKWYGFFSLSLTLVCAGFGVALLYVVPMVDKFVGGHHSPNANWFTLHNPYLPVALIPPLLVPAAISFLVALVPIFMALNLVLYLLIALLGIWAFGWRLAASSVWNEITVEAAPLGKWNLVTLSPRSDIQGLRHCLPYADPTAIEQTIAFINYASPSLDPSRSQHVHHQGIDRGSGPFSAVEPDLVDEQIPKSPVLP